MPTDEVDWPTSSAVTLTWKRDRRMTIRPKKCRGCVLIPARGRKNIRREPAAPCRSCGACGTGY